jgi:riboflavin kinase
MKQRLWYTLYKLAELGAVQKNVTTSTTEFAKTIDASQQTASRHLAELEKTGYIMKQVSFRGVEVRLTDKGTNELRRVYLQFRTLMEGPPKTLAIEGTVFSGLGEGAYYVSQREYKRQFERKIGFAPYPGTLNMKLSPAEVVKKKELEMYQPTLVEGFESRNRKFGDVQCYPTTINDKVEGAVIIINRTHYDDSVVEVIAPVNLKSRLNIKDGDKVTLKFFPSKTQVT